MQLLTGALVEHSVPVTTSSYHRGDSVLTAPLGTLTMTGRVQGVQILILFLQKSVFGANPGLAGFVD